MEHRVTFAIDIDGAANPIAAAVAAWDKLLSRDVPVDVWRLTRLTGKDEKGQPVDQMHDPVPVDLADVLPPPPQMADAQEVSALLAEIERLKESRTVERPEAGENFLPAKRMKERAEAAEAAEAAWRAYHKAKEDCGCLIECAACDKARPK